MSVWTVQTSVHTTVTTLRAHLSALVVTVMFWNLMATVAKSQVYALRARANIFFLVVKHRPCSEWHANGAVYTLYFIKNGKTVCIRQQNVVC